MGEQSRGWEALFQGGSLAPWLEEGLTWHCLVGCLGGPLLPGAVTPPPLPHSCPRPSLALVVAALGLTQSHC